jgi:hypothetical protein
MAKPHHGKHVKSFSSGYKMRVEPFKQGLGILRILEKVCVRKDGTPVVISRSKDRRQRTENRGQKKTEDRGQKSG